MSLNLRIIDPSEFINLTQEGTFAKNECIDALRKLVVLGRSSNILIDFRKTIFQNVSHLDMVDIVDYMVNEQDTFSGNKIGILLSSNQLRDPEEFFEKYSRKKGLIVRVFDSYESAIEWLSKSSTVI
jgi:hypothetical protein